MGKKRYNQKDGVGKSKYVISYHDGKKKHKDGSDFFDIQIFRNKKDLAKFVNTLHKGGYKYGFDESVNEDTDVGHQDDEPNMLKSTALEVMEYGKKLMDKLDKYDDMEGEVDFPNWWQSKLTLAKDYLQKAYHYLDSEEKTSETIDRSFRTYRDDEGDDEGPVDEGYGPFIKAKNLNDIIKLSKQKKNATFYVTDDNNSRIGTFYLRNGKFAKATTANPNYDLQRNKTKLKDRSDVIYKYKVDESVNEAFVVAYGKGPKPIKPAFAAYADKKMAQKFMADMKKLGYKVMMTQKKIRGIDEDKTQIVQLKKKVGKKEIKFYDALSKLEKKMGKKKYRNFLVKSLKDFKVNGNHYDYRTNAAAEEKLFQLAK